MANVVLKGDGWGESSRASLDRKNAKARERRAKKREKAKSEAAMVGPGPVKNQTVDLTLVAIPAGAARPTVKDPGDVVVAVTASEAKLIVRMKAKVLEIGFQQTAEEKTHVAHKAAKAALEQAREDLVEMVRAVNREEPLTDRMEPDGWKRIKIEDAIGVRLGRKFVEGASPILQGDTLGGMTAFLKLHRLIDARGVGAGAAKKIEDAMEAFSKRNPQWTMVPPEKEKQ